jgi:hypothetical protein
MTYPLHCKPKQSLFSLPAAPLFAERSLHHCSQLPLSIALCSQLYLVLLSLERCPAFGCRAAMPLLLSVCLTEFQSSVVLRHSI